MDYERLLRRIRSHDALYGAHGEAKEIQAERIRDACIRKLSPAWRERHANVIHAQGQRLLNAYA